MTSQMHESYWQNAWTSTEITTFIKKHTRQWYIAQLQATDLQLLILASEIAPT